MSLTMTQNMVLRFRDLVADTITEHRNYIKKYGYVWWGWWNKPEERIPRNEFSHFQDSIAESGFLWVFLADSGTLRLYKAKLMELYVSDGEEPIECKDIEKVPEYYFMAKYKVWFRFQNIIDAFPDEICEWSYDKKCSLTFEDRDYTYHDKQVSSLHEMLNHRHRTIYFIQPYNPVNNHEHPKPNMESDRYLNNADKELDYFVQDIIETIESINKQCDIASKKGTTPICLPPYPKEMENALKRPAKDETSFRDFSSCRWS